MSDDETTTPSIEDVKNQAMVVYRRLDQQVVMLRKERHRINKQIAELLPQRDAASRLVRATAPRQPKGST